MASELVRSIVQTFKRSCPVSRAAVVVVEAQEHWRRCCPGLPSRGNGRSRPGTYGLGADVGGDSVAVFENPVY